VARRDLGARRRATTRHGSLRGRCDEDHRHRTEVVYRRYAVVNDQDLRNEALTPEGRTAAIARGTVVEYQCLPDTTAPGGSTKSK
jgi:hypothetical protein